MVPEPRDQIRWRMGNHWSVRHLDNYTYGYRVIYVNGIPISWERLSDSEQPNPLVRKGLSRNGRWDHPAEADRDGSRTP